jgi:tetratricopeptide (TPR) repeat protein
MLDSTFVDRVDEIAQLELFRRQVHARVGCILSVEGQAGIGKSQLIKVFSDAQENIQLAGVRQPTRFYTVLCNPQVGQENAYGPFLDLLVQSYRARNKGWRKTRRVVLEAAPALLELVPEIGPVLKTSAVTAKSAFADVSGERYNLHMVARAVSQEVLRVLGGQRPTILVIEDAHLLDASSCAVLRNLHQAMYEQHIGVVLACRSEQLARNDEAQETIDRLHSHGALTRLQLGGLPKAAIADYAAMRTGVRPAGSDLEELARGSGGHPLFLEYFFSHSSPSDSPTHGSILTRAESLIRSLLRSLDSEERLLLRAAACQGERFLSSVVTEVAGRPPDEVLSRLHRIAEDTKLIRALESPSWILAVDSDWYAFHHGLIQEVLFKDQSEQERRNRHRVIAATLQRLVDQASSVPREVLLEVVRQHHLGGNRMEAAQQALAIARRLAAEGSSPAEVTAVCRQAIDDVREADINNSSDRVRAELIELFLTASELRWRGGGRSKEAAQLEALSEEALTAAKRTGDPSLESRMTYLRGKVFLHTRGIPAALDLLRQARELALTTRDPFSIFIATAEYGRQLPKVDLEAGIAVLREAEALMHSEPAIQQSNDPVISRGRDLTSLQLGVNLLDAGKLGEALQRLSPAVDKVRQDGGFGLLPIGLNYLGQALLATGQYDEAERIFREGHELVEQGDEAGEAWHANNSAHLGHLLVVYRGDPTGLTVLEDAWSETERTRLANLVGLVLNLRAAAFIHLAATQPEFYDEARQILTESLADSRAAGMIRSEVAALSLLARVELATGNIEDALERSTEAVSKLRAKQWRLPTICTEEILYYHGLIQQASGDVEEANATFSRARSEVDAKASTLPDERDRRRFLREIRLNERIRESTAT